MGNLFAFLVLLLTPFLVGWALYCFVFMGADAWPHQWTQEARAIVAGGFVVWGIFVAGIVAEL